MPSRSRSSIGIVQNPSLTGGSRNASTRRKLPPANDLQCTGGIPGLLSGSDSSCDVVGRLQFEVDPRTIAPAVLVCIRDPTPPSPQRTRGVDRAALDELSATQPLEDRVIP